MLANLDEAAALEALDALVDAQLLVAGTRIRFSHPIVRAAVYDEIGPGERSRLHREAAAMLAAQGAELDAVAAQLLASEPTGSEEVIATLREAAALARSRGAPENAVTYLSRALEEGCERELRAAVCFELGMAAKLAGDGAMAEHFAAARRLAADPAIRNAAALELASTLVLRKPWSEAMALIEEALEDLDGREPELALRLECLRAGIAAADPRLVGDFDRRSDRLRELASSESVPARSLALLLGAVNAWRTGDADQVAPLVERGFADRRPLASGVEPWALGQGLGALILCELGDRARELAGILLAEARGLGSLAGFILGTAYRGFVDARQGRLEDAEQALREALSAGA